FTPAPPGECWIWGLSYTGTVTAQVGDNATMVDLSDGCFDLSDNFVVIFRDSVDGGMVAEVGGVDTVNVCLADTTSGSGIVRFESSAAAGPNFAYVVTDTEGVILGLPPGNSVDFAPAGVGECWVWGLSYSGEVTAQVGDTATAVSLTTGCYDLSDEFVVVFRDSMGPGCVTSIADELSLEDFRLAPNPATDQVSISFWQAEALNQATVVTLYNLAGQQLQVQRLSLFGQGTQEFQLSVADLSQGMYLLQIQQGTRQMTTRLLKQ
ncbi:MAG: T9SS type A sorting domain-containing protein, partial [Bacteroidota bacterium]